MDDNESLNSNISWRSEITTCESFEKMLSNSWSNSKLQKCVLEIIVSLRNTIQNNGGSETATEFYVALIAFIKHTNLELQTLEACGSIMNALLSSDISTAVIRHTTSDMFKIISDVCSGPHGNKENVIRFALHSWAKLLSVQTDDCWRLDNIKHMYRMLFAFTCDSRTKINEYARKSIISIYVAKSTAQGKLSHKHPLNKETLTILTNNIRQQNVAHRKNNEYKNVKVKQSAEDEKLSFSLTTLCQLLLSEVLTEDSIISCMETLIQCLLSMQIVPIQCQILTIYTKLFRADILSPEVLARSLTSLFTYINFCTGTPTTASITLQPHTFLGKTWLNTALIGFERLLLHKASTFVESTTQVSRNSREISLFHATNLIRICADWLLSDDVELKTASNSILNKLCSGYLITDDEKQNYLDPVEYNDAEKWLIKWTEILGRHLSTQHETMWSEILENIAHLIHRSNGQCATFIGNVLQVLPKIAELRDSYEDTEAEIIASLTNANMKNSRTNLTATEKKLKSNIELFIAEIIGTYGVDKVIDVLPLRKILNEEDALRDLNNRTWLVPLVKSAVKNTSLNHFGEYFLPFIQLLTNKINTLSSNAMEVDNSASSTVAIASLGTLRYQLWSCLPSFARNVVRGGLDRVEQSLWDIVLDLLSPNGASNLELIALSTIRNIIKTAQDHDEMKTIFTGPVFFPILLRNLFSIYMKTDENLRTNIKLTLDAYLRLFEPDTFTPNSDFLLTKKLAGMDTNKASEEHLHCLELVIILVPHLPVEKIAEVTEYMSGFLDNEKTDSQIQRRVYRYLEIVTASNSATTNEYTKDNLHVLVSKLQNWRKVKNDCWKCRMKTLYNLMKLMNFSKEIGEFLNVFFAEIVNCLNLKTKKTRAVSGLILVEGIIGYSSRSEDEDVSLSRSIDNMLRQLIGTLREKLTDNSKTAVTFKEALSTAIFLILSETRLSKAVTRDHIVSALTVVNDILREHNQNNENRHLVNVALDILRGLLKSSGENFSRLTLSDFGNCLKSAPTGLLKKVRTPVKKILRKMLKWWGYEEIKKTLPDELVPVLRNLHKEKNRANRKEETANEDSASNATSWACFSETGSVNTMKNPNIKNIVELLADSDDEDDLHSRLSGVSLGTKSVSSTATKATELRKIRKRKIAEANATLWLEEKPGDVVDISDPVQLAQHLRVTTKDDTPSTNAAMIDKKVEKNVDKRGFKIEKGRLLIGSNVEAAEQKSQDNDENEDDEDDYKSKKDRFQPPKKRAKKEKLPGAEYKSHKKGVFGDMKKKDMPDPYAYVPLKGNFQGVMEKYEKETKKCLKAHRTMSKLGRQRKK